MLSRTDETELLEPLHAGVHETPPWATFLARLRQRTRSTAAVLMVGEQLLFSGEPPIGLSGRAGVPPLGSPRLGALRPGRVYASDELFDPMRVAGRRAPPAYARVMRVVGSATQGWLTVLREGRDFGAGDGAVMAGLAPHLAIALDTRAALARGERALVALNRLHPEAPGRAEAIAGLFGLSRSEARLADAIASGASLDDAAARCGLTRETARTYSKRIFAKTGARGQPDLVRLVLTRLAEMG